MDVYVGMYKCMNSFIQVQSTCHVAILPTFIRVKNNYVFIKLSCVIQELNEVWKNVC